MVYSPNMSKAFEGSYKTSKSRGAVVFAIEQVSTKDEKNIQPGQKFVIAGRETNYFKLLSADCLQKHPKGIICPMLEIRVKDSNDMEGSTIEYKHDIKPTFMSMTLLWLLALIFVAAMVCCLCSIFASFNLVGIIVGTVVMGVLIYLFNTKCLKPMDQMLREVKAIVEPVSRS